MNAGMMNRRIQIIRKIQATRRDGVQGNTEQLPVTVWARYIPLRGSDRTLGGEITAQVDTEFHIRRRTDFTPTAFDYVVYNGIEYDITEVREIGLNEGWKLLATARQAVAS